MAHVNVQELGFMLAPYVMGCTAMLLGPFVLRNGLLGLRIRSVMARRCGGGGGSSHRNVADVFWTRYLVCIFATFVLHQEVLTHYTHACAGNGSASTVLVVADPQLVDRFAYETLPEWAHYWTALLCDLQLKRSWRGAVWKAKPQLAVIVGDLFWGASHYRSERSYKRVVGRLNGVFGGDSRNQDAFAPSVPTRCIMGNHDNAMYRGNTALDLLRLWEQHFGPWHWSVTLSNVTLVGISNVILQDMGSAAASAKKKSEEWLDLFPAAAAAAAGPARARILFTHIPLYSLHRESGLCEYGGAQAMVQLRRKGFRIAQGRGSGYENVFDQQLTHRVLKAVDPALVISGDAHDLCEVPLSNGGRDVTLPSFSWMEGTLHHGYGLLSVGGTGGAWDLQVCWQPCQLELYLSYAVLGLFCFLVLLLGGLSWRGFLKVIASGVITFIALLWLDHH